MVKTRYSSSVNWSVDYEEVDRLLAYDAGTGKLTWKVAMRHGQIPAGTEAGYIHTNTCAPCQKQYRYVKIGKEKYLAHHLAWLLHYGMWLKDLDESLEIDHRDGDGTNNRISNLRGLTRSQNVRNRKAN